MSQLNVTSLKHESASGDNITLSSNGTVGIGTSSPSANNIVTISGATPNSKLLLTGGTTQNGLTFGSAGGGNQFYLYSQSGGLAVYDETAGTERLRIDSAGRVTMPYQPMFTANTPTTATLLSGSYWKFGGWNVIKNIGGHYNGTTGVFTAPVSGVYLFRTVIMGYDNGNSDSPHVGFSLNGSDNVGGQSYGNNDLWEHHNLATHKTDSMHLFYLNANDFVAIRALSQNIGQNTRTYFMGCLLG